MRNRLQDMTAHDQIERRVGQSQLEDAPVLEARPVAERRALVAGERQVIVDHVDTEQLRRREQLRQAQRDLSGAAARIKHARPGRQMVAREERSLLGPDRVGLRRERTDHRFVRHLRRLRIQLIVHGGT